MDPALANYLQNRNGAPMQNGAPQQDQQAPYNPFNSGIKVAIEAARDSMSMTDKQEEKALRRAMLSFAAANGQQPREKGFLNNFASITQAMIPAIGAYDAAEDENIVQNNDLANQIIGHRRADMAEQAAAEQARWDRQHAENQLAEQKRYHDLLNGQNSDKIRAQEGVPIGSLLNEAEKYILEALDNGSQSWFGNFARQVAPSLVPLNEEQASIDTIGDALKGKLFKQWGKNVPSISSTNSPEVNLAIIRELKQLLGNNHDVQSNNSTSYSIGNPTSQTDMRNILTEQPTLSETISPQEYKANMSVSGTPRRTVRFIEG